MRNLKTPLGIIGLLYLIAGLVMSVLMFAGQWYPTLLYFYTIGIGIFFLLISGITKRLPRFKLWQTLIGMSPIMAFCAFIYINEPSDDVFIIPNNYRGYIKVIYGQEDGVAKEFEDDKRIYRIPGDGVLRTQFRIKGNSLSLGTYYYENNQKERTKLKTYTSVKPFPDSTAIYVHDMILGVRTDEAGNRYEYHEAAIGTQTDSF